MKVRKIKKQFNKVAKEAIKENAFLKKFGLYDITTIIQRYNKQIFKEYESKKDKKAI